MNNSRTLRVRRIAAIVLMLFTLLFMFWPDYYGISASNPQNGFYNSVSQSFWAYRSEVTENMQAYRENFGSIPSWGLSVIALNAAYFALIALAVASVVLMLLNRTKATLIAHAVLAAVTGIVVVLYWSADVKSYNGNGLVFGVVPGAAMFLLPLFSLAAFFLYKRDKSPRAPSQDSPAREA